MIVALKTLQSPEETALVMLFNCTLFDNLSSKEPLQAPVFCQLEL